MRVRSRAKNDIQSSNLLKCSRFFVFCCYKRIQAVSNAHFTMTPWEWMFPSVVDNEDDNVDVPEEYSQALPLLLSQQVCSVVALAAVAVVVIMSIGTLPFVFQPTERQVLEYSPWPHF